MHITKRTAIVLFVVAFTALAGAFGLLVAAYVSTFAALSLVIAMIGYSAFVALRNWGLGKLPSRHTRPPEAVEPSEERRRAA
jgi:hypothetical protein